MVQIAVQGIQISNRIGHVESHACLWLIELIVLLMPHPQNGGVQNNRGMFGSISWYIGYIKVCWYEAVWQRQFQVLVKFTILPGLQKYIEIILYGPI